MKGRKMKKVESRGGPKVVNNRRGSHLWAYNHFRTSIITSLLNDLIDCENEGIEEGICRQIKKSLNYYINASTNVPSGGFLAGGSLYKEIESFYHVYEKWNGVDGTTRDAIIERRNLVRVLRKKRQNITDKIRRLQFELENNLDQKILYDSYQAIGDIINMVPGVFKNLSLSYSDYLKRGGQLN
jgi:hypothetical protein